MNPKPSFIEPEEWGHYFWSTIESVIISMDSSDDSSKEFVYLFLYTLQNILPCPECREHYQNYFGKHNVKQVLHSKEKVFEWLYFLRKEINDRKQKPSISFERYKDTILEKFHLK